MSHLSRTKQGLIAAGLALFMIVTRSPQIPGSELLHSGSWAVFFTAGVYLSSAFALPSFLALAFILDAMALGWAGVSAYCFTPTYGMLIPAYGCLWAAGRWYAQRHRFAWRSVAPLAGSAAVGGFACEAFSSGGFYWLGGYFADPSLAEFAAREMQYLPPYMATLFFWVAVAALIHVGIVSANRRVHAPAGGLR